MSEARETLGEPRVWDVTLTQENRYAVMSNYGQCAPSPWVFTTREAAEKRAGQMNRKEPVWR